MIDKDGEFIAFVCKSCSQEIEASSNLIGEEVECPACGRKITVPPPDQAPSPAQQAAMKSRTIRIELDV